ncbi:MAG: response regulator [Saprospiraceae bacterium]|nr:response regulator [Saprospiraceae bacterium]
MPEAPIQLLLADDDQDDCLLFSEAISELSSIIQLRMVHDGAELLKFLSEQDTNQLPDIIFLDLNMPKKTGYECLIEIRQDNKFKHIPVVIFSTSFDPKTVSKLQENGADHYIRKPADFTILKNVLKEVLAIIQSEDPERTNKDNFILLS